MLDDVAFRPLPEDPARKDTIPFVVALILHAQLHEGAGFRRVFPRGSLFAGPQTHDRAADARRIARFHLKLAHQPVSLVEQAQHRGALGHRGRAFDAADFLRHLFGAHNLAGLGLAATLVARAVAPRERRNRQRQQERGNERARHRGSHSAPGRQAS
ncbi:hypothetical protein LH20_16950 [Sphingopyxis sp. 113P3]|nr:hypothetical protein LH20_16950 [Sphingopyxis sp. 113P3]